MADYYSPSKDFYNNIYDGQRFSFIIFNERSLTALSMSNSNFGFLIF